MICRESAKGARKEKGDCQWQGTEGNGFQTGELHEEDPIPKLREQAGR